MDNIIIRVDGENIWMSVKTKKGRQAMININAHFPKETMIDRTIREWAVEQATVHGSINPYKSLK